MVSSSICLFLCGLMLAVAVVIQTNAKQLDIDIGIEREIQREIAVESHSRHSPRLQSSSCASPFPQYELNALQDLFTSANGQHWAWSQSPSAGSEWNFSQPSPNPCAQNWQGVNCSSCSILGISLSSFNLSGTLPASLGQLNSLNSFHVGNNRLHGVIPQSFGNWTRMYSFDLHNNFFSGPFPGFVSNFLSLAYLTFQTNSFTGFLPSDIGNLVELLVLNVRNNRIGGSIPASITSITTLQYLYLHSNAFTGNIPEAIGDMIDLEVLDLACNLLVGSIPDSLTALQKLSTFFAYNNSLIGSIPNNFNNLIVLEQFSVNNNSLSGTIPSFSALDRLVLFRADDNKIRGSLPNCFDNIAQLAVFNVTKNRLTGTLPDSLIQCKKLLSFDAGSNELSGSLSYTFAQAYDLQEIVLNSNYFTGTLEDFISPEFQAVLSTVDVSNNKLSGQIPNSLFQLRNITVLSTAKNCFTGSLPDQICRANQTLQTLVLDGLHTQNFCQRRIFSFVNTYFITSPVQGTLPACLFSDMNKLSMLHISGNGIEGSIPDVSMLPSSLKNLSLAHNRLKGPIPLAFQTFPWTSLDLSYNKLNGELSNEIYSFESSNSSLTLLNNRLSGEIPANLKKATNIDMLSGNMFSCDVEHSQLPPNDPHVNSYECASDSVNDAIYMWCGFVVVIVGIYFSDKLLTRFAPTGQFGGYLDIYHRIHKELGKWWVVYTNFEPHNKNLFEFGLTMREVRLWSIRLTIVLVVIFIPTFAALTSVYGTYSKQYAWTISVAFLSGYKPAVILMVLFLVLLVVIYSPTNKLMILNLFRVGKRVKKRTKLAIQFYESKLAAQTSVESGLVHDVADPNETDMEVDIDDEENELKLKKLEARATEQQIHDELHRESVELEIVKFSIDDARKFYHWYAIIGTLVVINVSVVIVVNMAYVYAISTNINANEKQTLSFSVSVFKLIWNGTLMDYMYYYIHSKLMQIKTSQVEMMSKRSLLLPIMLWLSIFNNIIVPFIAVAFISTNCFYFAVYPSEPIDTTVSFYQCSESIEDLPNGSTYASLSCNSDKDAYTISYNPPFAYSFQCTSSLLSNFTDIFLYRYILGGAVVPILTLVLKVLQEYVLEKFGWESELFHFISFAIPIELRPLQRHPKLLILEAAERQSTVSAADFSQQLQESPKPVLTPEAHLDGTAPSDRSALARSVSIDVKAVSVDLVKQTGDLLNQGLTQSLDKAKELSSKIQGIKIKDINKMLGMSADEDMSFGLYSSIILFATDIAVLLTFGVMFPPLAIIGCGSIYIRTYYMQLTLGRIIHLSHAQPQLAKVVKALNEECIGISKLLMTCLLSLPLLLSMLWSWFLFDIWGDQTGFNPAYYIIAALPMIPLVFLPIVFPALQKYVFDVLFPTKHNWDKKVLAPPSIDQFSTTTGVVQLQNLLAEQVGNPMTINSDRQGNE